MRIEILSIAFALVPLSLAPGTRGLAAEIGGANPEPRVISNGSIVPDSEMTFMVKLNRATFR